MDENCSEETEANMVSFMHFQPTDADGVFQKKAALMLFVDTTVIPTQLFPVSYQLESYDFVWVHDTGPHLHVFYIHLLLYMCVCV